VRPPRCVAVGDTAAPRAFGPITATHIVRFAGAGGDFNPLHHDPAFATAAGFPGIIAMGQLPAGVLAAFLSDWLGVEHVHDFEVRFVAPVAVGDLLELTAEIVSVEADSTAAARAAISLAVTVAGQAVVTARATARVHPRSSPEMTGSARDNRTITGKSDATP
jgi:3-hydroxybutyryl-CoA dehydratase